MFKKTLYTLYKRRWR